MIPDEAVEAAWDAFDETGDPIAALRAAAPHLTRPDAEIVEAIRALLRSYRNGEIDADQFVVYAAGATLRKETEA